MDDTTFTDDDQGKRVVNDHGDKIGMISEVRGGTAYVDPDPGIGENIMSKLGWGDADQEDYPLESSRIADVTDDEVRLRQDL